MSNDFVKKAFISLLRNKFDFVVDGVVFDKNSHNEKNFTLHLQIKYNSDFYYFDFKIYSLTEISALLVNELLEKVKNLKNYLLLEDLPHTFKTNQYFNYYSIKYKNELKSLPLTCVLTLMSIKYNDFESNNKILSKFEECLYQNGYLANGIRDEYCPNIILSRPGTHLNIY